MSRRIRSAALGAIALLLAVVMSGVGITSASAAPAVVTYTVSGHVDLYDAFGPATAATTGDVVVGLQGGTAQSGPTGPLLYGSVAVDSSGDWAIAGVSAGNYFVRFDYTGGLARFRPTEFFSYNPPFFFSLVAVAGDVGNLDFVYGGRSSLAGVVTDNVGNPLSGVTVLATGYLSDGTVALSRSAVSDASGRYQFENLSSGAAYQFAVDFDLPGYSPAQYAGWGYYYDAEYIDLPDFGHVMLDTVALTHPGSISGTVTSSNIPPADFAAGLVKVEVQVFDSSTLMWVGTGDIYVVQADGTYSIPDLYPDDYKLKVTYKDTFTTTLSPMITVGDGGAETYNGSISATPLTIPELFAALGGASVLGSSTSAIGSFAVDGGGKLQHFAKGTIYASNLYGTFVVWAGPIRDQFLAANSIFGAFGWPIAEQYCGRDPGNQYDYCVQSFVNDDLAATSLVVFVKHVVTGLPLVGGTATIAPASYSSPPTSFSYAWMRDGVKIPGATGATYVPVAADLGHVLDVQVTAFRAGYLPTISMSYSPGPTVGPSAASQIATRYATAGGSAGPLGPPTSGVVAFTQNGGGSLQNYVNGSIYASAAGAFVMMSGPIRDQYWAMNSFIGYRGWPQGEVSCVGTTCSQSFMVGTISVQQTVVSTPPTISGIAKVGGTLTVNNGTYTPAATSFTYAWFRNGVRIVGATAKTYVPVAGDLGLTLTAEVTAKSASGMPVAAMSAATGYVAPTVAMQIASLAAANPTLGAATSAVVAFPNYGGGSLQHFAGGSIYSSNLGGTWIVWAGPIRDAYWAEGSINGSYQWPTGPQVCALGSCSQPFLNGSTIFASPLAVLTPPTIGGGTRVGGTLVANPGTYAPVAQAYTYAWFRNGVRVAGATGSYVLTAADLGATLEVEVTAGRSGSVAVTTRSAPTAAILPSAASLIAGVAAANAVQLGAATSAVVSFPDNGGGALQHYKNGSIYASNITGTFIVWAGPIRDTYWAANSIFGTYKWPSGPQDCSLGPCSQPFLNGQVITANPLGVTTPPTVGGVMRVGGTLVATPGTYSPAAQAITYSWFRDAVRVPGSTASYALTAADEGHTIKVEVTAGRSGFVAVTTLSAPTAPIGPSAAASIAALRALHPELGNSTTAVVAFPDNGGGSLQHFQNGSIYSSNITGTFIVQGSIRTKYWAANSIFGVNKWPTAAEDCSSLPCVQQFQGGTITG